MFKSYSSFFQIQEKENSQLFDAEKMAASEEFSTILKNAKESKYSHVQINITPGAKSYVGVAIDDNDSISEVYSTEDPCAALLAIIMKSSGKKDKNFIKEAIRERRIFLKFAVFAGDEPMSREEVISKYNLSYEIYPGDAISFFTSTPIRKYN
jgi:hypothetical protein